MKFLPKIHEILLSLRDNRDGYVRVHFQKGVQSAQDQQWDLALDHLSRVVARKGDHFQAHLLLAEILQTQGKYEEALRHYAQLKEISPVRYRRFGLAEKHRGLEKFLTSTRSLRQLSGTLEIYARSLNLSAKKMQDAMRRQQETLERLAEVNRNLRRQRAEIKGTRPPLPSAPALPAEKATVDPRKLPPITREEVAKVDWDALMNQLLGRDKKGGK